MGANPANGVRGGEGARRRGKPLWIDDGREERDTGVELGCVLSKSRVTSEDVLAGLDEAGRLGGKFEELAQPTIGRAAVGDPGGIIEVEEEGALREEGDELLDPGGTEGDSLTGDKDGVILATLEEVPEPAEARGKQAREFLDKLARSIEAGVLVGVKERGEVALDAVIAQERKVLAEPIAGRRGLDRPGGETKKMEAARPKGGVHRR